jgi:hypothetical protein
LSARQRLREHHRNREYVLDRKMDQTNKNLTNRPVRKSCACSNRSVSAFAVATLSSDRGLTLTTIRPFDVPVWRHSSSARRGGGLFSSPPSGSWPARTAPRDHCPADCPSR